MEVTNTSEAARLGLLFSGQGSQKAGMGAPWRATSAWAVVDEITRVSGHDVAELLLDADDERLRRTDRAQIATFALEMIVHAHYVEHDGRDRDTAGVAGHSLGEYSALAAAGILDLEAAARLVAERGAAMREAAEAEPGTMMAVVGASSDALVVALEPLQRAGARIWIANLNAPDQTVVAGDHEGIERAATAAREIGKVLSLPVGGAFHSPLMASAEARLRAALADADFASGTTPVVANVDAQIHRGGAEWRDLLARQLTAPVQWTRCVRALLDDCGCREFVEIGPGNTLSNIGKRIDRTVPISRVAPPGRASAQ